MGEESGQLGPVKAVKKVTINQRQTLHPLLLLSIVKEMKCVGMKKASSMHPDDRQANWWGSEKSRKDAKCRKINSENFSSTEIQAMGWDFGSSS